MVDMVKELPWLNLNAKDTQTRKTARNRPAPGMKRRITRALHYRAASGSIQIVQIVNFFDECPKRTGDRVMDEFAKFPP
jgi:hypothetical protein